jgi:hypothetical protein
MTSRAIVACAYLTGQLCRHRHYPAIGGGKGALGVVFAILVIVLGVQFIYNRKGKK